LFSPTPVGHFAFRGAGAAFFARAPLTHVVRIVEPAQNLDKPFRQPLGDDVDIKNARSPRPRTLITAGPSAGADLFCFSLLIERGYFRRVGLRTLCGARVGPRFSTDSRRGFKGASCLSGGASAAAAGGSIRMDRRPGPSELLQHRDARTPTLPRCRFTRTTTRQQTSIYNGSNDGGIIGGTRDTSAI
jgi:hypothetical protein